MKNKFLIVFSSVLSLLSHNVKAMETSDLGEQNEPKPRNVILIGESHDNGIGDYFINELFNKYEDKTKGLALEYTPDEIDKGEEFFSSLKNESVRKERNETYEQFTKQQLFEAVNKHAKIFGLETNFVLMEVFRYTKAELGNKYNGLDCKRSFESEKKFIEEYRFVGLEEKDLPDSKLAEFFNKYSNAVSQKKDQQELINFFSLQRDRVFFELIEKEHRGFDLFFVSVGSQHFNNLRNMLKDILLLAVVPYSSETELDGLDGVKEHGKKFDEMNQLIGKI